WALPGRWPVGFPDTRMYRVGSGEGYRGLRSHVPATSAAPGGRTTWTLVDVALGTAATAKVPADHGGIIDALESIIFVGSCAEVLRTLSGRRSARSQGTTFTLVRDRSCPTLLRRVAAATEGAGPAHPHLAGRCCSFSPERRRSSSRAVRTASSRRKSSATRSSGAARTPLRRMFQGVRTFPYRRRTRTIPATSPGFRRESRCPSACGSRFAYPERSHSTRIRSTRRTTVATLHARPTLDVRSRQ